jgi:hypothetical protein
MLMIVLIVFVLSAGVTGFRFVFLIGIIILGYFVLKKFNSEDFLSSISKEKFPDTIINDNYK